ncbi:Uncharacterised protein [Bordetella pertussis]|nr:Uncharacterised protein [Bordetella pertussis]CFN77043.1 Uncharacterised protein [Bordetella pertussis]CFO07623.1 Uncharacterised protein [Bordetella pertussis]CFP13986.1 Uncharacterised protein [Bordetella pertussis]CFP17450.1 Uncharacterised protein [Bordetella pertussis]
MLTTPPTVSVTAWLPPLYGTCSSCMPASRASSAPAIWAGLPGPAEAYERRLGLALASATSSAIELTPTVGLATSSSGVEPASATGAKSRATS